VSISRSKVHGRTLLTAILRDVTERVRAERALKHYQLELTALTQRLMAQEKQTTQRLAQALHDQLGQTLLALRLSYEAASTLTAAGEVSERRRLDERVRGLIAQASREVRRVLIELRPPLLEEEGLEVALDNEVRSRAASAGGARIEFDAAPSAIGARWPSEVEYAAFMVAREAIGNALKHAAANRVNVTLAGGGDEVAVKVEDDGVGMPADAAARVKPGHLGMVGMRERAAAIGARFIVEPAPTRGTRVTLNWKRPG
jgi:signal transduction histidine kinase